MTKVMSKLKRIFQEENREKLEHHGPVIEAPDLVKSGEYVTVRARIGEEIPHPHKEEHHIGWIVLFFRPEGERFPHKLGKTEFSCKEEAIENQEVDSVYATHHEVALGFKPERSGTIFATCMCTLHGVWQGCKDLKVK